MSDSLTLPTSPSDTNQHSLKNKDTFNSKYYYTSNKSNANSLFATFKIFSIKRKNFSYRTPFPPLISSPNLKDVILNINKSDVCFYLCFMGGFLIFSVFANNKSTLMRQKLITNHVTMHIGNLFAIFGITIASYSRLIGTLDNGLRWKRDNHIMKYDFTSEFEKQNPLLSKLRSNKV